MQHGLKLQPVSSTFWNTLQFIPGWHSHNDGRKTEGTSQIPEPVGAFETDRERHGHCDSLPVNTPSWNTKPRPRYSMADDCSHRCPYGTHGQFDDKGANVPSCLCVQPPPATRPTPSPTLSRLSSRGRPALLQLGADNNGIKQVLAADQLLWEDSLLVTRAHTHTHTRPPHPRHPC